MINIWTYNDTGRGKWQNIGLQDFRLTVLGLAKCECFVLNVPCLSFCLVSHIKNYHCCRCSSKKICMTKQNNIKTIIVGIRGRLFNVFTVPLFTKFILTFYVDYHWKMCILGAYNVFFLGSTGQPSFIFLLMSKEKWFVVFEHFFIQKKHHRYLYIETPRPLKKH